MIVVGLIVLGSIFFNSTQAETDKSEIESNVKLGMLAPDFVLTRFDGSEFRLSDYRGKKSVYLMFWNTWCGYCHKKIPLLKQVQNKFSDEIVILAINTSLSDTVDKMAQFNSKEQLNYPIAFDHEKKVTDLYKVWGTPTSFIIDINGVIQYRDHIPTDIQPFLETWNTPSPA